MTGAKRTLNSATQISLFVLRPLLSGIVCQLFEGAVETEVQGHPHRVTAGKPSIGAPCGQQKHT
jgi:hypothetical protein